MKCKKVKSESEFALKKKKRHSWCKECFRSYAKEHYQKNKKYYIDKSRRAKLRKVEYIIQLRLKPCTDCRKTYPYYVMEFDHRNPEEKSANITSIINNSWKKIKEELVKCDVVCANCHRIRTHKRRISLIGGMVDTLVLETNP